MKTLKHNLYFTLTLSHCLPETALQMECSHKKMENADFNHLNSKFSKKNCPFVSTYIVYHCILP